MKGRIMDESLKAAVKEHLSQAGEMTGYLLISFNDGIPTVSSAYLPSDGFAALVIPEMADLLSECEDEIGPCEGEA